MPQCDLFYNAVLHRLQHLQSELESNLQCASAHAQSLQASLASAQKEREQLQSELHQARSALESRASEREYMQSEASCLQQALHKQMQETQQAQQACDSWMNTARQQVVGGLSDPCIDSSSTAKILIRGFLTIPSSITARVEHSGIIVRV